MKIKQKERLIMKKLFKFVGLVFAVGFAIFIIKFAVGLGLVMIVISGL